MSDTTIRTPTMLDAGPDSFVPSPPDAHLVRAIGRWAFVAIVINSVVGSGIFGLPSALVGLAGRWSPLTVVFAGAAVFLVVLCLAEVAGRFDETGGPYLFTREAFGAGAGFQIGWIHVCTRLFSAAAVLNVLVGYSSAIIPWIGSAFGRAAVMTLAIGTATYVNVIGVKQGSRTVSAFTIAKLLPLIALILLGIWKFSPDVLATQTVAHRSWTDALVLLIFGYGGFETAVVPAGETRAPRTTMPFALIFSIFAITALYSLVQLVVVGVLPDAKDSSAPIAATLGQLLGPVGVGIGSAAVVISVYGWIVGSVLTMPRLLFAMAVRGEMPEALARIHPRYHTPHVATIVTSVVALLIGIAGGFQQMATFSAIGRLAIFGACCGSMIMLRRTRGAPAGFAAPGGVVTAAAAIVFCLWLLSTRNLSQAWVLPLIVLVGWIIWMASKSRRERFAAISGMNG